MIIRKLQDTANMTEVEKEITNYILENGEAVINMTARQLADATYTSASSVLRLCSRIDEKGFSDFKMRLASELTDQRQQNLNVDINYPFMKEDSIKDIVEKMEDLSIISIRETRENLFRHPDLPLWNDKGYP